MAWKMRRVWRRVFHWVVKRVGMTVWRMEFDLVKL
jgi:hypothetical protein